MKGKKISREVILLRVLINRFHPYAVEKVVAPFPQKERETLLSVAIEATDFFPLFDKESLLKRVHPSWLKASPLSTLLLAFPPLEKKEGFDHFSSFPVPLRKFLISQLLKELKMDEHLPLEYLPQTPLSALLDWNKEERMNIINCLGLNDLAPEVRPLVNRQYLNNIYSCLTSQEQAYLKICLSQKEKIASPKLGIDPTQKECEGLRKKSINAG